MRVFLDIERDAVRDYVLEGEEIHFTLLLETADLSALDSGVSVRLTMSGGPIVTVGPVLSLCSSAEWIFSVIR